MNKRHPTLVDAEWVARGESKRLLADGWSSRWVAARPIGAPTLRERFRLALGVFTGKYDAIKWKEK